MTRSDLVAVRAAGTALGAVTAWIAIRGVWSMVSDSAGLPILLDLVLAVLVAIAVYAVVRRGSPRRPAAADGERADPLAVREQDGAARGPATSTEPAEGRSRRSEKLESIGEFTGAVAHDFNNLLTAIITPVQLLLADLAEDHPLRAQLEEVEDAATRGAALSGQLLAFSRKQVVKPRPYNLNEIVTGLEPMLRRLLGPTITLHAFKDPHLRSVMVDVTQMEQVLVNLVVNARDAMPDGGLVTVSTSNVDPQNERFRAEGSDSGSGYVVLEVRDTGHGFGDDVRARIFEPYFTTKEHGTGLGLATVFGIARQCNGFVRVDSAAGVGSSFRIYLPGTVEPAQALTEVRTAARARNAGGSELVLVVEDQEPVRQVLVRAMTRFGYRVAQASNAASALQQAQELGANIDLLLTDVMLPESSGPELANQIREFIPGIKVIYVSGYADPELFDEAGPEDDGVFLPKPFSVDGLLATVRRVLDGDDRNVGWKSG
jgi:signal transduction histidine kinase/ActR/RegA family two-component response regulator